MPRVLPIKKRRKPRYGIVCTMTAAILVLILTNMLVLRPVLKVYETIISTISDEKGEVVSKEGQQSGPGTTSETTSIIEGNNPTQETSNLQLCRSNPFTTSLSDSLDNISATGKAWLEQKDENSLFQTMSSCLPNAKTRCFGQGCESSKRVCGMDKLPEECIIYVIGRGTSWKTEMDLMDRTPCEIHTFDCSAEAGVAEDKPEDNRKFNFHHLCLGSEHKDAGMDCDECGETWTLREVQEGLGHSRIDLFFMADFGLAVLDTWEEEADLPLQLLLDVQEGLITNEIAEDEQDSVVVGSTLSLTQAMKFQERLLQTGYTVIERSTSTVCDSCTSLTLIRTQCIQEEEEEIESDGYDNIDTDEQEEGMGYQQEAQGEEVTDYQPRDENEDWQDGQGEEGAEQEN